MTVSPMGRFSPSGAQLVFTRVHTVGGCARCPCCATHRFDFRAAAPPSSHRQQQQQTLSFYSAHGNHMTPLPPTNTTTMHASLS